MKLLRLLRNLFHRHWWVPDVYPYTKNLQYQGDEICIQCHRRRRVDEAFEKTN